MLNGHPLTEIVYDSANLYRKLKQYRGPIDESERSYRND
jgi:hypothetical protein